MISWLIVAILLADDVTCTDHRVRFHSTDEHENSLFDDVDGDELPLFRATPRNVTVGPGDRAVLVCRVDNLGTRTVTWKRYDEVHPLTIGLFTFAPDTRIGVDYNQRTNEWSLIIQDVRPMDEGVYQCQISTKNNHESYDVTLNVRTVQVSGTDYVERGGSIKLVCNASGRPDPPHDVEWFKDNEKIRSNSGSGIFVAKKIEARFLVSLLTISNINLTDSGEYACRTSNRESGAVHVQVLTVDASVGKRGTLVEKMVSHGNAIGRTCPIYIGNFALTVCVGLVTSWPQFHLSKYYAFSSR